MLEIIVNLDRRIIFVFIAIAVALPLIFTPNLPMGITPSVKKIFDKMESLKPGDAILFSGDYDPSSAPELEPMNIAIARHALKKDLRILTMDLWPAGPPLMEGSVAQAVAELEKEGIKKEYGKDYLFLGYKIGGYFVIDQMGSNIAAAFPMDKEGKNIKEYPITEGVNTLSDFSFVISLAAGSGGINDSWVPVGQARYGIVLAGGCTAVSAPELYPFLDTGQLLGLMSGLKGAAEYEKLLNDKYPQFALGTASSGMASQSIAHVVIVLFIIIGNIAFFMTRKQSK